MTTIFNEDKQSLVSTKSKTFSKIFLKSFGAFNVIIRGGHQFSHQKDEVFANWSILLLPFANHPLLLLL